MTDILTGTLGIIAFIVVVFMIRLVTDARQDDGIMHRHHPDVPLPIPPVCPRLTKDPLVTELVALGPLVITSVRSRHLYSPFNGESLGSVLYEVEMTRLIAVADGTPLTGQSTVKFTITGSDGRLVKLEETA